jgi:molecular chaperone Hsp33
MLQRLAAEDRAEVGDDEADDAWHRALLMLGSARDAELLDPALAPNDLLYRLFHEDGVRVWAPQPLGVGCTCSRERVERVLRSFAPAEMADMVVDGRISARCEFCTATYDFAAEELGI